MKSIEKKVQNTILIKKSKFITYLFPISQKEDIDTYIEEIHKREKNSSHICYAYRFENLEKCNDDGEPSQTAGMPILNTLKQKDLQNILCIVVRYFGGIKLGVGGLYRAYATSCKEAIEKSTIVELTKGCEIQICFSYKYLNQIDFILTNAQILKKSFGEDIIYNCLLSQTEFEKIKNHLLEITTSLITINPSLWISK